MPDHLTPYVADWVDVEVEQSVEMRHFDTLAVDLNQVREWMHENEPGCQCPVSGEVIVEWLQSGDDDWRHGLKEAREPECWGSDIEQVWMPGERAAKTFTISLPEATR